MFAQRILVLLRFLIVFLIELAMTMYCLRLSEIAENILLTISFVLILDCDGSSFTNPFISYGLEHL